MWNFGLGFVLGLVIGSYIKCLADRSVTDTAFLGRSYCPECKHQLRWYDLFPILSYILTKGRCRYCGNKIPLDYPLIEFITALLTAWAFSIFLPAEALINPTRVMLIPIGELLIKLLVIYVMVIIFLTDLKTGLIPDRITYPSSLIALILLVMLTLIKIYFIYQSIVHSLIGKYLLPPHSTYLYRHALDAAGPLIQGLIMAVMIGLFFLSIIWLTKGRGMGGGDLKLGIFIGLALGFPLSLISLVLSFLIGSVVGVGLLLIGKKKLGQTIPFGPFLSLATIISVFYGQRILDWYLNLKLS